MVAALSFAENVEEDGQHGARLVPEVPLINCPRKNLPLYGCAVQCCHRSAKFHFEYEFDREVTDELALIALVPDPMRRPENQTLARWSNISSALEIRLDLASKRYPTTSPLGPFCADSVEGQSAR